MTRSPSWLCVAIAPALLAAPAAARAQGAAVEVAARASLDRPECPVVLTGDRLAALHGAPIARLRALAVREGRLAPIPLQVDERVPEGSYALDHGDERRSDPDDGALDANDELVIMTGDAGDRLAPAALEALAPRAAGPTPDGTPTPAGARPRWVEVELSAAGSAGRAWVYLGLADGDEPPLATEDRIALDWQQGELAGWTSRRARVACIPGGPCFLDLRELAFRRADGAFGPDVLDRVKLSFAARYLFLDIARHMDELRARVVAWRDGPLRAILRFQLETYLIWGHWVRSTARCRATIWEHRLELDIEMRLPVALEADSPSELRLGLDLAPAAVPAALWTDRHRGPLRAGSQRARDLREVDRAAPRWLVTTCGEGAFALRLELGPELERPGHRLSVLDGDAPDPPEDHPGSILSGGWTLDLTGLPAQAYRARIVLQLGAPVSPGEEQALLRIDDDPVKATVAAP